MLVAKSQASIIFVQLSPRKTQKNRYGQRFMGHILANLGGLFFDANPG